MEKLDSMLTNEDIEIHLNRAWISAQEKMEMQKFAAQRDMVIMTGQAGMEAFDLAMKRHALLSQLGQLEISPSEKRRIRQMIKSDDKEAMELASAIIDQLKPMSVQFLERNHSYKSLNPDENIDWVSVTSLVGQFKEGFDARKQAEKSSKNPRSKWYGMTPTEVESAWKAEGERANTLGDWYHKQREADLTGIDTIEREGLILPIVKPIWNGETKIAPAQNLVPGIYPEHFVYLKSAGICGQSDRVEVIGQYIDIVDYKTNKEIRTRGYKNYEGIYKKMLKPLSHLEECELNLYALQLSMYMYIIQKHNHQLKPRNMFIHHIIFEEAGKNEFGYPIARRDQAGEPIVKDVIPYSVPYLKREVIDIVNWLKDNRNKLNKKQKS